MEISFLIPFLFFCWLWIMTIVVIYLSRQTLYDEVTDTIRMARERLKTPFPHEMSETNFNFRHPVINVEEYHVIEEENLLTYSHLGKNISVLSYTKQ
tara:strand:+ start:41 stop:331 length:291 start_codon:yes stop_codon:yes gene_type:complete